MKIIKNRKIRRVISNRFFSWLFLVILITPLISCGFKPDIKPIETTEPGNLSLNFQTPETSSESTTPLVIPGVTPVPISPLSGQNDIEEMNTPAQEEKKLGVLDHVGGFFTGFVKQGWDTVTGVFTVAWDGVRGLPILGDVYGFFDPKGRDEVRRKYSEAFTFLWDGLQKDPINTISILVFGPIKEDWDAGRYGEAIGRGAWEIALFFVPFDEVRYVGKIDQMTPDEFASWISRIDKLTPDEIAGLLARIDKLTPDELAGLLSKPGNFHADQLALLYKRLDTLTPDEASALIKRLDDFPIDQATKLKNRLQDYRKRWEFVQGPPKPGHELHHSYPQEFRDWFYKQGIDIDDPKNMLELPEELHTGKGGVHHPINGKDWNTRWAEFIEKNPQASKEDIKRFREQIIKEFGVGDYLGDTP